jgi:glycosyltransferase involved in cell wall biosynthesis
LPVITTLHGTDITLVGADRSYLPITRYGLQQSDGVTAVSKFLKQATIETFDFDEIEVIPNFICAVSLPKNCPIRRFARTRAERRKILVHVSNFRAVKRPIDCVEIFAKVLQKGGNARLVMVGDGPEYSACSSSRRVLNVLDKTFSSANKRKSPIISAFPTFRFCRPNSNPSDSPRSKRKPAKFRSSPRASAAFPEVVNDGETGFMSDIGDTEKMSDDVLLLLNDEEMRLSFGKRGRELAISRYSSEKIIPQYIQFYYAQTLYAPARTPFRFFERQPRRASVRLGRGIY